MEWSGNGLKHMKQIEFTKKMLNTIRKREGENRKYKVKPLPESKSMEMDNFLRRAEILMEEAEGKSKNKKTKLTESQNDISDGKHDNAFPINRNTPQFGDIRTSQEDAIVKTIGERIKLDNDALLYYPDAEDIVLNSEIPSLNITLQFRYNDPSGDGCYVWADGLQLTDSNSRTLGKIRDAFMNWKDSLTQSGDLMEKLKQAAQKEKNENN